MAKCRHRENQWVCYKYGTCDGCSPPADLKDLPPAITVTINSGLDTQNIEHIQLLEKQLDAALLPCGYARSTSSKAGDRITFNYWQCAVILGGNIPY